MADNIGDHPDQQPTNTGEDHPFSPDSPPHFDATELLPLQPLPEEISTYKAPENQVKNCGTTFPSLRPFYKYGDSQALWDRRKDALDYASDFLNDNSLGDLGHLGRKVSKSTFRTTMKLLNDLTDNILEATIRVKESGVRRGAVILKEAEVSRKIYTLEPHRFMALYYHLQKLILASTTSFKALGKRIPSIPDWPQGAGSLGEEFLMQNEFEIFTITFRSQVEQLLLRLDYIHDYSTDRSHFSLLLKEAYGSDVQTKGSKKRDRDIRTTDSISQIVRSHRKENEPYTSKAQGRSSYGMRSHKHQSNRPRSTRKVEEIFEEDSSGDDYDSSDEEQALRGRGTNAGDGPPSEPDSSDDSDGHHPSRGNRRDSDVRNPRVNTHASEYVG